MDSSFQEILVATARRCLGTPFCHQGRVVGVGLDCIGLVVVCYRSAGFTVSDTLGYGRRPDGVSLCAALVAHGGSLVEDVQPGDVLVFRYDGQPQHVGLATDATHMIHSFALARRVVETRLGSYWQRRLVGIYRFSLATTTQQGRN